MSSSINFTVLLLISLLTYGCGGGGAKTTDPVANHPEGESISEESPVAESPVAESPVAESPVAESPVVESPVVESPVAEEPAAEVPIVENPVIINPPQTHHSYEVKSKGDAARFLSQTTFGPTLENINELFAIKDYEKWIDAQLNTPATLHFPKVKTLAKTMCADQENDGTPLLDSWEVAYPRHQIWWETAMHADDQLRQRVALALSEILVISDSSGLGLSSLEFGVTSYYDVLVKHAFGNYRDLLEEVTLHPAMGDFLSMTRNRKADTALGIRPDENYAREILQLFTIGVHELTIGGEEKKDTNNEAIPTYNQQTIEEFAKVFTGWTYAGVSWDEYFENADHTKPLVAEAQYHDTSEKTLLYNQVSPANQTAQVDLDFALDNIFNHPNVAPFISKQLIQRLVTSNPAPDYIARVAAVFNDNGNGVKGDLKAVVKAILLDNETLIRNTEEDFGKLREPLLRISHLWRAFKMQPALKTGHYWESHIGCGQGNYEYYHLWYALDYFKDMTGQGPLQAKSVFNFFKPDYSPAGLLNDNGLAAPEFQILNENTITSTSNLLYHLLEYFSDSVATTPTLGGFSKLNLAYETSLASNTDNLLDHLNLVLMNGSMSTPLRNILKEHLNQTGVYPAGEEGKLVKAREAIMLMISSPEYLIQR